mmetsp:Transcript_23298/g.66790  ORF Transcript_23298/g.66790 Transcript_23298/m.66790 type:complete len:207 (-) Transcript_23298:256-876(-)
MLAISKSVSRVMSGASAPPYRRPEVDCQRMPLSVDSTRATPPPLPRLRRTCLSSTFCRALKSAMHASADSVMLSDGKKSQQSNSESHWVSTTNSSSTCGRRVSLPTKLSPLTASPSSTLPSWSPLSQLLRVCQTAKNTTTTVSTTATAPPPSHLHMRWRHTVVVPEELTPRLVILLAPSDAMAVGMSNVAAAETSVWSDATCEGGG